MQDRAQEFAVATAAAVAILLFWLFRLTLPALELGPQSGDSFHQIYPMWLRASEWMRQGSVPLWNPYQMCGHPFLASVLYGIFYPLNFARMFVDAGEAMEITLVLHLFSGWYFTYAYCRSGLLLSVLASAFAATAFGLGGFLAFEAGWFLPAVGAAVWLPLALLGVEKTLQTGRWSWAAVISIAVAMPLLAGWLQTWMYTVQAVALYSGTRLLAFSWAGGRSVLAPSLRIVSGVALGVALAAVQLLPSAELQSMGWRRPGGLTLVQQIPFGPTPFRTLWHDTTTVTTTYPRPSYMGLAPLLLLPATLALPMRIPSQIFALWILVVWGVGVAMTVESPLFWLYRWLPGGTWFRIPTRILFLYAFAGAVLAGFAVDRLASDLARTRRLAATALVVAAAFGLLAAGDAGPRAIAYVAGTVTAACVFSWSPRLRPVMPWVVLLILLVDLTHASSSRSARPFGHVQEFEANADVYDFLRASQGYSRTYLHDPWPFTPARMNKQATMRGVYMVGDYEVLSMGRMGRYCDAMADAREPTAFIGICLLNTVAGRMVMLDRLGVRFAMVPDEFPDILPLLERKNWKLAFRSRQSGLSVYENPRPIPRAYVSYTPFLAQDEDEALDFVRRPLVPATAVVLEKQGLTGYSRPFGPDQPITPAEIVAYEPRVVTVRARAERDGFLVLSDTFYPGWSATVDGVEVPLLRANYLFRAVRIPAGEHLVRFEFRSATFERGALASLASLFLLGGFAVLDRRRRADDASP